MSNSRWYGYAVGHWEGDTFALNSNNFGATWLDQYGSPHSDQMIVEERYHHLDHDHLVEKSGRSEFNDLPENICAFSEGKLHGKARQHIHL